MVRERELREGGDDRPDPCTLVERRHHDGRRQPALVLVGGQLGHDELVEPEQGAARCGHSASSATVAT
jgi:hypothetical protein